jgi:hypothetical protein
MILGKSFAPIAPLFVPTGIAFDGRLDMSHTYVSDYDCDCDCDYDYDYDYDCDCDYDYDYDCDFSYCDLIYLCLYLSVMPWSDPLSNFIPSLTLTYSHSLTHTHLLTHTFLYTIKHQTPIIGQTKCRKREQYFTSLTKISWSMVN